jgi:hypothetical protein
MLSLLPLVNRGSILVAIPVERSPWVALPRIKLMLSDIVLPDAVAP